MKLFNRLVLITSFFTSARALVGGSWSMTNVLLTGLNDITFPITIVEADHISGYYFAQRFSFQAPDSGRSIGIQPCPLSLAAAHPLLHGVFSTFVRATKTDDPNCNMNSDGRGVSCAVDWVSKFGYQYNLEVKTPRKNLWIATAFNVITGRVIHIGSFTLPDGFFGIAQRQTGFIDWLPWDNVKPPNHCAHLPYQQTIFGHPTMTHEGSVGTQNLWYESGDCNDQINFYTREVDSGVITHCGFRNETGS